jgi:hypothetical protein
MGGIWIKEGARGEQGVMDEKIIRRGHEVEGRFSMTGTSQAGRQARIEIH